MEHAVTGCCVLYLTALSWNVAVPDLEREVANPLMCRHVCAARFFRHKKKKVSNFCGLQVKGFCTACAQYVWQSQSDVCPSELWRRRELSALSRAIYSRLLYSKQACPMCPMRVLVGGYDSNLLKKRSFVVYTWHPCAAVFLFVRRFAAQCVTAIALSPIRYQDIILSSSIYSLQLGAAEMYPFPCSHVPAQELLLFLLFSSTHVLIVRCFFFFFGKIRLTCFCYKKNKRTRSYTLVTCREDLVDA